MSIKTRKVSDLPIVEETAYYANVLIEEGGSTKRMKFETDNDALDLLSEMGVLEATINEEGFILTDENNNILTM